MGKKGSIYERELKGILSGDESTISKFKTLSEEEMRWYRSTVERPFMVVRAAGSLGVDLIAIRDDFSFPIEVKSSSERTVRFTQSSSRAQLQAESFSAECSRAGIIGIYAFRLKGFRGDPWRIFALPGEGFRGRTLLLYNFLPKIPITRSGNFILRWDQGVPLSRFLSYLNYKGEDE